MEMKICIAEVFSRDEMTNDDLSSFGSLLGVILAIN